MGNATPDLTVLQLERNEGYGTWRLPCERDEEIAALVGDLVGEGGGDLDPDHVPVLVAFVERMATLARREGSSQRLRTGLEAAALASAGDEREALLVLPLLWRSAEVLGLAPEAEFRAAASRLGDPRELVEFAARDAEDRSIEAMGYVEVDDEFGFRYERTW